MFVNHWLTVKQLQPLISVFRQWRESLLSEYSGTAERIPLCTTRVYGGIRLFFVLFFVNQPNQLIKKKKKHLWPAIMTAVIFTAGS